MSTKKPRRGVLQRTGTFMANLAAGEHGPVERARMVAGNLMRRNWFGRREVCCGNYGDPGC